MLGRFLPRDVDRLPIPDPPAGPEPLLAALSAYAGAQDFPPIDAEALRPAIAALDLGARAEIALAQLVLAYTQAVRLQDQAVAGFSQEDLRFLTDPAEELRWLAQDPSRTTSDATAHRLFLEAGVDQVRVLQAADLLARTVEAVRVPLGDPPASSTPGTSPTTGAAVRPSDSPDEAQTTVGAASAAPPSEAWDLIRRLLPLLTGDPRHPAAAPDRALTLDAALNDLASAYGLPGSLALPPAELPPSLDHALAIIVAAKAAGVRSGDAGLAAHALMQATEEALPTLDAWAAVMASPVYATQQFSAGAVLSAAATPAPSPATVMARALGQTPPAGLRPPPRLHEALAATGMSDDDARAVEDGFPTPVAVELARLLDAMQAMADGRDEALAALTPAQRSAFGSSALVEETLAKQAWTPEEAALIRSWAEANAALPPSALDAMEQARLDAVAAVEEAVAGLGAYADLRQLRQASDSPRPPLGPAEPVGAAADPFLACPETDFSACGRDVWLDFAPPESNGCGILVTGFSSTVIDQQYAGGCPSLVLDLGGDDTYLVPAGAADGRLPVPGVNAVVLQDPDTYTALAAEAASGAAGGGFVNIAIDVGGNDVYRSNEARAQGAAIGVGALGVLWDAAGDDRYTHFGKSAEGINGAQGFGGLGGLGLLVDGGGSDVFDASQASGNPAYAQGVGLANLQGIGGTSNLDITGAPSGSGGFLLDLGTDGGADVFKAKEGQGLAAHGDYSLDSPGVFTNPSVGVLVDQSGKSTYEARAVPSNQGGRVSTPFKTAVLDLGLARTGAAADDLPLGLGMLIDLGGQGDTYSTADAPGSSNEYLAYDGARRKQDDTIWYDAAGPHDFQADGLFITGRAGLGLGIDTTFADEDGDLCPNFLETLKGSNPHSTPGTSDCTAVSTKTFQDLVDDMGKDSDGDGRYPDAIENATGSDPYDPGSAPADGILGTIQDLRDNAGKGILLQTALLCDADAPKPCPASAMPVCDPVLYGCVSLLTFGGIGNDTYAMAALVAIDLGGDDEYPAGAGGTHSIALQGNLIRKTQAYSLDLAGNDRYGGPGVNGTQGSDSAGHGVALLLDLQGDDTYIAGLASQGAGTAADGHGVLVDFRGNDRYEGGAGSQGASLQASAGTPTTGRGALVDLAGNDNYTFVTQARTGASANGEPLGLVFDQGGNDTYRNLGEPVDGAGLGVSHPGTVFDSQGFHRGGLFLDAGGETDTYLSRSTGGAVLDVSHIKNDIARGQRRDAAAAYQRGGYFVDNPRFLADDTDGDDTFGLIEVLTGSNPTDPSSSSGTVAQGSAATEDPRPVVEAPQPLAPTEPFLGVVLPGLRIGGRGPSTYTSALPFQVDLGGSDLYLAHVAASRMDTPDFRVVLLLDVAPLDAGTTPIPGEADDVYAPAPCTRDAPGTTPWSANVLSLNSVACPSLGAATGGIALLADTGGSNTFETIARAAMTVNGNPPASVSAGMLTAEGFTQGAARANGVGVVATWESTNRFRIDANATLRSLSGSQTVAVRGHGNGQGYSDGGIGLLATFGAGEDDYSVATAAQTVLGLTGEGGATRGLIADFAQGSVSHLAPTPAQLQAGSESPMKVGILFDGGGRNVFQAPHGRSQGSGGLPVGQGVLWSGAGDDTYRLGQPWTGAGNSVPSAPSGQGAGTGVYTAIINTVGAVGVGILLDGGGGDRYVLDPPLPSTQAGGAASQGANLGGYLFDLSGDDFYGASEWTVVQAVQGGALLDLGGHDVYRASDQAQAWGAAANAGPSVLLDAGGDDSYRLLAPAARGQGSTGSVFIDGAGNDAYSGGAAGHSTARLPGSGPNPRHPQPPAYGCNGCSWQASGSTFGADADHIDQALAAYLGAQDDYNAATVPTTGRRLQFPGTLADPIVARKADGSQQVAFPQEGNGTLHLFACLAVEEGVQDDRMVFLLDGAVLGRGERLDDLPPAKIEELCGSDLSDVRLYRYSWDTRLPTDTAFEQAFPDGEYQLKASAFFAAAPGAPHPDIQAVDSDLVLVALNNPPLIAVSPAGAQAVSTLQDAGAALELTVSRDHKPGQGATDPGSAVTVVGQRGMPGPAFSLERTAWAATSLSIPIVGAECSGSCPDGLYNLTVRVADSRSFSAQVERQLLVDGTRPTSAVSMPALANAGFATEDGGMVVHLQQSDPANVGSDAEPVSGITAAGLLVLNPSGTIREAYAVEPGAQSVTIQDVRSGDTLRLATVAVDRLGNQESPCDQDEARILSGNGPGLCAAAKLRGLGNVTTLATDFVKPAMQPVKMMPAFVRPGAPVEFTANVTDTGSGVAGVAMAIEGLSEAVAMAQVAGTATYRYAGWGTVNNATFAGKERFFSARVDATDAAGNVQSRPFSGRIDDRPPRVTPKETAYVDGLSQGLLAGRLDAQAPVTAILRATIEDLDGASMDPLNGLKADLGSAGLAGTLAPCKKGAFNNEFNVWACPVLLDPALFDNGTFDIRLVATDRAGNLNASATAPLVIRSSPLDLRNVTVTQRLHDGFTVRWDTDAPGTSQVRFGQTPELGQKTQEADLATTTNHTVAIAGLAPSTDYYFQVVTRSRSGIVSASPVTSLSRVRTLNAFTVESPDLPPVLKGTVGLGFGVHLSPNSGDALVHMLVQVQDAAGLSSPLPIADASQGDGVLPVSFDTRRFADGAYVLRIRADRPGDFLEVSSGEFRIDNTPPLATPTAPRPGTTVTQPLVRLRLQVLDPILDASPQGLAVWVDNVTALITDATLGAPGPDGQRPLEIALAEPLDDGLHTVTAQIQDGVANAGRAEWGFRVDTRGPAFEGVPRIIPEPGPAMAKPGGRITVRLNLTDPSGVATASFDAGALGGNATPLLALGGRRWEAVVQVPAAAVDGRHQAAVLAVDRFGNPSTLPLEIEVDATPPTLAATASPAGFTKAIVNVTANEPVRVEATVPGRTEPVAGSGFALVHTLTIDGLRPGQTYNLAVGATDRAGVVTQAVVQATPRHDTTAPGIPAAAYASSEEESTVHIGWSAAADESGIDHYRIVRLGSTETVLPIVPGNRTEARDTAAPAGQVASYRIQAIDLAGLAGPAVEVQARVLSLPHLGNLSVTPERGASADPFHLRALYWTPSGRPAERVEVLYAGKTYPLLPAHGNTSCAAPCAYEGEFRLPPTPLRDPGPPVFRAAVDGRAVEVPWNGTLVVLAGGSSEVSVLGSSGRPAPGFDLLLALAAAAAAFVIRRKRQ